MAQAELLDRDGKVLKSYRTKGNPPKSARRQRSDYVTETITGAGTFFSKKFIEDTINNIQKNPVTGAFAPKGDPRKLSIPLTLAGILFVRSKTPEKKKTRVTLFGLAGIIAHEIFKSLNDNVGAASGDGNSKGGEELVTEVFGPNPGEEKIILSSDKIFNSTGEISEDDLEKIAIRQKESGRVIEIAIPNRLSVTNGFSTKIMSMIKATGVKIRAVEILKS